METKTRGRVRIKPRAGVASRSAKREMTVLVNKIDENQLLIKSLTDQNKKDLEKLQDLMASAGTVEYITVKAKAVIASPPTRTTRTIPVPEFKKMVSPREFMDSVTVPISAAKKVLTENEIDKIAIQSEGKQNSPVVKVTHIK